MSARTGCSGAVKAELIVSKMAVFASAYWSAYTFPTPDPSPQPQILSHALFVIHKRSLCKYTADPFSLEDASLDSRRRFARDSRPEK